MAEVKEFELKISTKQAQENLDEVNKSLKLQEDLVEQLETELRDYEKQLDKTSKKDLAARKSVNDAIKKTKTNLKEEKAGLSSVTKERKRANETLKEATENSADYGGVLGMIDSKTGGLISGLTGMTKSIGGATKGFNLMKVAIIGTGIGALLLGILAVSKAFTSSEEGQNKFAKIMGVIGSVTGNLVTMLSDLGEKIIGVFENPKQALIDFGNLLKDQIVNRFIGMLEYIPAMGKAISLVFKGEFKKAGKVAADAVGKVVLGVENVTDKIADATKATGEFIAELQREAKIAAGIADKRAKADKLDRKITVERAEANRKRAELLDKAAQKETFTAKQRIQFLTEAGEIEEEITNKEIAAAKLRLDAKVSENALANSTKEDLVEEANLRAQLINLETAKLRKAKAVSSQILGANREEAADLKKISDAKIADEAALQKFKDGLVIKDKNDKLAAIEKEKADRVLALEGLKVSETEKNDLLLEIDAAYNAKKEVIDADLANKEIKRLEAVAAEEIRITKLVNAQKKALQDSNLNNISQGFALLGQIAGKNKALQAAAIIGESAVGIAKTVIATQASNAATIAQGAALAIPTAGASVAAAASLVSSTNISAGIGIAMNVAATAKALSGLKAGGSPPPPPAMRTGSGSSPASMPTPPEFNTVGASGTNQLADAIGNQTKQPIKTYVVASDVTTAQSLERNIITGATVG